MSDAWPWLALLGLGAFHGINPGMGWLFAVALEFVNFEMPDKTPGRRTAAAEAELRQRLKFLSPAKSPPWSTPWRGFFARTI